MSRERGLLSVSICNSNPQNFVLLFINPISLSFFLSLRFLLPLAGLCLQLAARSRCTFPKQAFLKEMRERAVYMLNSLSLCFEAGFLGWGLCCTHARGDEEWFCKTNSSLFWFFTPKSPKRLSEFWALRFFSMYTRL